jgi:hypothetical protein
MTIVFWRTNMFKNLSKLLFLSFFINLIIGSFLYADTKANVHYIKKGKNEFIYVKGQKLDDYTVVAKTKGLSLDLKDAKLKERQAYMAESGFVDEIYVKNNNLGSNINVAFLEDKGFKVYKRPTGLMLAMGEDYKEISEDDLKRLETKVSEELSIDKDLDFLILNLDDNYAKKSEKISRELDRLIAELEKVGSRDDNISKELDRLISEFESDPKAVTSLYAREENSVVENLLKPRVVKNISYKNKGNITQVVVETDKPIRFNNKYSETSYNQVVLDLENTYVPSKERVTIIPKEGIVNQIKPYQMGGKFKTARLLLELNENINPKIYQRGKFLFVDFPNNLEHQDIIAARNLSNRDFRYYLEEPLQYYGSRMSIALSDADVIDALNIIKQFSDINIVVSDKVQGRKINISLKDIPWDQALSLVVQEAKLGYIRQGSVIRVATLEELRDERVLAKEALDAHKNLEPLKVMLTKLDYVDADHAINKVKTLLSKRGKVSFNPRNNTILIHDIKNVVLKANKLIKLLDSKPKQIAIEASIIEANSKWLNANGFSWDSDSGNVIFRSINGIGDIDAIVKKASINEEIEIISKPKIAVLDRHEVCITQGTKVALNKSDIKFKDIEIYMNILPVISKTGDIVMNIDFKREFLEKDIKLSSSMPNSIGVKKAKTKLIMKNGDTAFIGGIMSGEDLRNQKELIILIKAVVENDSFLAKI